MFEDRTRCHADHVGHGLERHTCAAVGILKGVHAGTTYARNRVTKDVVAFDAAFFSDLVDKLQVGSCLSCMACSADTLSLPISWTCMSRR